MFPLLYAIGTSFKSDAEVNQYPPTLWPQRWEFGNYGAALRVAPIARFLLNSFIQSGAVTVGQLVTSALAAFAFTYIEFPGRGALFFLFLSTLMIPAEVTLIPNYMTVRSLGWLNTYPALAAPFLATAFGTFLLRQFFLTIPRELWDAAVIDGCSRRKFLMAILVPLARPAFATLAIYAFLSTWNQYLWPLLVINSQEMRTVQIGLLAALVAQPADDEFHHSAPDAQAQRDDKYAEDDVPDEVKDGVGNVLALQSGCDL